MGGLRGNWGAWVCPLTVFHSGIPASGSRISTDNGEKALAKATMLAGAVVTGLTGTGRNWASAPAIDVRVQTARASWENWTHLGGGSACSDSVGLTSADQERAGANCLGGGTGSARSVWQKNTQKFCQILCAMNCESINQSLRRRSLMNGIPKMVLTTISTPRVMHTKNFLEAPVFVNRE